MSDNICPLCPRGCSLNDPHFSRGESYRDAGKRPEGSPKRQEHQEEHSRENGFGRGRRMGRHVHPYKSIEVSNHDQKKVLKGLHHASAALHFGGIIQDQAEQLFAPLSESEIKELGELLETLSNHWMGISPNQKKHHSK